MLVESVQVHHTAMATTAAAALAAAGDAAQMHLRTALQMHQFQLNGCITPAKTTTRCTGRVSRWMNSPINSLSSSWSCICMLQLNIMTSMVGLENWNYGPNIILRPCNNIQISASLDEILSRVPLCVSKWWGLKIVHVRGLVKLYWVRFKISP